jgi:hypothetical protein
VAEIIVACPECGLHVKVTSDGDEVYDAKAKCNHRQNPLNCPMLWRTLVTGRRAVRPPES